MIRTDETIINDKDGQNGQNGDEDETIIRMKGKRSDNEKEESE